MAIVKVMAGVCGMSTTIKATADQPYGMVTLEIESDCPHVQKMAAELQEVKSLGEIRIAVRGQRTCVRQPRHCRTRPALCRRASSRR